MSYRALQKSEGTNWWIQKYEVSYWIILSDKIELKTILITIDNQAIRSQIKIDKLKKLLYVKYPKDLTSISNYFIQKYEVKTHEKEKESLERQSGSKRNFFTNSKVKSFVLYNESSPIDPLVDIKISLIIDEKNINCYDEKVYIDLIGIHHSQLDDFDRLMNVWDFLMMIRSLLNIQPFTPLDLALSIEGTSEVVLLKYVFSRILETIIKDTYQNDNNFELSYYWDLTDHEKLPGYLIYFLSNCKSNHLLITTSMFQFLKANKIYSP